MSLAVSSIQISPSVKYPNISFAQGGNASPLEVCPVPPTDSSYPCLVGYLRSVALHQVDLCKIEDLKYICEGNLGLRRKQMPQLNPSVMQAYVDKKVSEGVRVTRTQLHPSELTPTQGDISIRIIAFMIENFFNGAYNACQDTILVARGGLVIDGHHRLAACTLLDRKVDLFQVNEKPGKMIGELRRFEGTEGNYSI